MYGCSSIYNSNGSVVHSGLLEKYAAIFHIQLPLFINWHLGGIGHTSPPISVYYLSEISIDFSPISRNQLPHLCACSLNINKCICNKHISHFLNNSSWLSRTCFSQFVVVYKYLFPFSYYTRFFQNKKKEVFSFYRLSVR